MQINYGKIYGTYYYDKVGIPIYLSGEVLENSNFTISENSVISEQESKVTGYFNGTFNENRSITGKWTNADKSKEMTFELKENYLHSASFKYYSVSDSFYLRNNPKLPSLYLDYIYIYPSTTPIRAALLQIRKNFSKDVFGIEDCNTVNDCIERSVKIEVESFNDIGDVSDEEIMENPYSYASQIEASCGVYFNDNDILTIYESGYYYTGGVHGSSYFEFSIYDLKTGNRILFEDIVLPEKEQDLLQLIIADIENSDYIDFIYSIDEVFVSNNIGVNKNSISFYYNEYEIAPYVAGPYEVVLKYSEIKDFLAPEFKEKMGIE